MKLSIERERERERERKRERERERERERKKNQDKIINFWQNSQTSELNEQKKFSQNKNSKMELFSEITKKIAGKQSGSRPARC